MKRPYPLTMPAEVPKNPISPGVSIGHVHLKVASIKRTRAFYVDILGFEVIAQLPQALFLSAGGYHHHLAFNTWESKGGTPPAAGTTGLYHVALRYPDRKSLGNALWRLKNAKYPLEGVNDHGTHEALYLRDPDDNGLELYWDRPESEWPLDDEGHLIFGGGVLDIEGLLAVGKEL